MKSQLANRFENLSKVFIHDSLKAGVYEIQQGMSIRQVLAMLSNADNAQMNRILVIEGTTFKQLVEILKKILWLKKAWSIYRNKKC